VEERRSGTSHLIRKGLVTGAFRRVSEGTRTPDRLDHNQELYQLSYAHRGVRKSTSAEPMAALATSLDGLAEPSLQHDHPRPRGTAEGADHTLLGQVAPTAYQGRDERGQDRGATDRPSPHYSPHSAFRRVEPSAFRTARSEARLVRHHDRLSSPSRSVTCNRGREVL